MSVGAGQRPRRELRRHRTGPEDVPTPYHLHWVAARRRVRGRSPAQSKSRRGQPSTRQCGCGSGEVRAPHTATRRNGGRSTCGATPSTALPLARATTPPPRARQSSQRSQRDPCWRAPGSSGDPRRRRIHDQPPLSRRRSAGPPKHEAPSAAACAGRDAKSGPAHMPTRHSRTHQRRGLWWRSGRRWRGQRSPARRSAGRPRDQRPSRRRRQPRRRAATDGARRVVRPRELGVSLRRRGAPPSRRERRQPCRRRLHGGSRV